MTQDIKKLVEAIVYIDNEALRLKAEGKTVGSDSEAFSKIEFERRELYEIKGRTLNVLLKKRLLLTAGYKVQDINGHKNRVYLNKVVGDDTETLITSLRSFTKIKKYKNNNLGTMGIMSYVVLDTDLDLDKAKKLLDEYIQVYYAETYRSDKTKNGFENDNITPTYSVKETKLVDISKLRIVKDFHKKTTMNPEKYEKKKAEMIEMIESDKDRYPKSEALIVRKAKDPEDKRRIIYELEDGLRRLVIAQELGLEKLYVDIVE